MSKIYNFNSSTPLIEIDSLKKFLKNIEWFILVPFISVVVLSILVVMTCQNLLKIFRLLLSNYTIFS